MYHVTNRIRGMIYVWNGCSLNQLGPRTESKREEETERKRGKSGTHRGKLNCSDYFYSVVRVFFLIFSAAIIPLTGTAGCGESLQFVECMMAQPSPFLLRVLMPGSY